MIEVVQNDKAAALEDAQLGVKLEPDLAAPRIALSYAQQANFDLKGARETLLEATAKQPENALAWSQARRDLADVRLPQARTGSR